MKSVFLVILITLCTLTFSQTPEKNLEKYWKYRDRLKYFVSIGDQPGESCIAGNRNFGGKNDMLRFGQHITYFGEYVALVTTEYKLLSLSGNDTTETIRELYYILEAYKRFDKSESKYPWHHDKDILDGFAVRVDVPATFIQDQKGKQNNLNPGLKQSDTFEEVCRAEPGKPAYVSQICASGCRECICNNYMDITEIKKTNCVNQDDLCPLFSGMALIIKCLPDKPIIVIDNEGKRIKYNFADTARMITYLSIRYLANADKRYGDKEWRLYRPDSSEIHWRNGGDIYYYGRGFVKTMHTLCPGDTMGVKAGFMQQVIWQACQVFPLPNNDNRSMTVHLAVTTDSWRLMGINTTCAGIRKQAMVDGWKPYYLLFWKYLHDKKRKFNRKKAEKHLNTAPENGPYCYEAYVDHAGDKWASSSRYWHSRHKQKHGNNHFRGNYNGMDYMLLYNLYHLIYYDELPAYK